MNLPKALRLRKVRETELPPSERKVKFKRARHGKVWWRRLEGGVDRCAFIVVVTIVHGELDTDRPWRVADNEEVVREDLW